MASCEPSVTVPTCTDQRVVRATKDDVVHHWPYLRNGLMAVKARQDRHSYWQPEHIRWQILNDQAELWLVVEPDDERRDQNVILGFFVTTQMNDPFIAMPVALFVWAAYATGKCFDNGLAAIVSIAYERGFRYVETISPRPGLVRKLTRRGWRVSDFILRKDLYDG